MQADQPQARPLAERRYFDVFISHAGEDKETIAIPLYRELRQRRVYPFLDKKNIWLGQHGPSTMKYVMQTASIGVFLLSPEFCAKEWPMKELQCFLKRHDECVKQGQQPPLLIPVFHRLSWNDCGLDEDAFFSKFGNVFANPEFGFAQREGDGSTSKALVIQALKTVKAFSGVERQAGDYSLVVETAKRVKRELKNYVRQVEGGWEYCDEESKGSTSTNPSFVRSMVPPPHLVQQHIDELDRFAECCIVSANAPEAGASDGEVDAVRDDGASELNLYRNTSIPQLEGNGFPPLPNRRFRPAPDNREGVDRSTKNKKKAPKSLLGRSVVSSSSGLSSSYVIDSVISSKRDLPRRNKEVNSVSPGSWTAVGPRRNKEVNSVSPGSWTAVGKMEALPQEVEVTPSTVFGRYVIGGTPISDMSSPSTLGTLSARTTPSPSGTCLGHLTRVQMMRSQSLASGDPRVREYRTVPYPPEETKSYQRFSSLVQFFHDQRPEIRLCLESFINAVGSVQGSGWFGDTVVDLERLRTLQTIVYEWESVDDENQEQLEELVALVLGTIQAIAGIPPVILGVYDSSVQVIIHGCAVLRQVASRSASFIPKLSPGIFKNVVDSYHRHAAIQQHALYCLGMSAHITTPEWRSSAFQSALFAMEWNKTDPLVQEAGCFALGTLGSDGLLEGDVLIRHSIEAVLDAMQNHETANVQSAASAALWDLSRKSPSVLQLLIPGNTNTRQLILNAGLKFGYDEYVRSCSQAILDELESAAIPRMPKPRPPPPPADKDTALAAAISRGVTMRKPGKWQTQLYFAGKPRSIGVFDSREKAARAYEIARGVLRTGSEDEKGLSAKQVENLVNEAQKAATERVNEDKKENVVVEEASLAQHLMGSQVEAKGLLEKLASVEELKESLGFPRFVF